MKVAAIQMDAIFADVQANLKKAGELIEKSVTDGAQIIILPEFFTSAIAFSKKMFDVSLQNEAVLEVLRTLSQRHNIIIGGSSILFDGIDAYNVFQLVFPNGQIFSHKKDLPTQFENCYYTRGDSNNILHTPIGKIGVALCWEMLRYDTVRRLAGQVDIIFAGSCWWDLPDNAPAEKDHLRKFNQQLAIESPAIFARLLRVPLIHSSHCGKATAMNFPHNNIVQTRGFVGAAQIVDEDGVVIAKRSFEQGEGAVIAELQWGGANKPIAKIDETKYWIPELPEPYIRAWENHNPVGEAYYNNTALPKYKNLMQKLRGGCAE